MKTSSALFAKYSDYLVYQTKHACSFEGQISRYKKGQEEFIKKEFLDLDRNASILDCACGDGTGLQCFESLGFKNVVGVELCREKARLARRSKFKVFQKDMHKLLSIFRPSTFDIIFSSHTLEHAFDPDRVVRNFHELLRFLGSIFIVLPYPDEVKDKHRKKAHCGSEELGLTIKDKGKTAVEYFLNQGFGLVSKEFNSERESEIWLKLERI